MGLFDLFKPKWKHSDPEVRLNAVRRMVTGEAPLVAVVRHDADPRVRKVAIKKLDDPVLLESVAADDADETVRAAAAEKAAELLLAVAVEPGVDEREAHAACERLRDPHVLAEVAKRAAHPAVQRQALGRLADQRALADVALTAQDAEVRAAAFARLTDPGALRDVAIAPEATKSVALQALERIDDPTALEAIADRAKSKVVRGAARNRLKAMKPAKGPDPAIARKREAEREAAERVKFERERKADDEKARRIKALATARARQEAEEAARLEAERLAASQAAAERAARDAERQARDAERAARDAERAARDAEKQAERQRVTQEREAERARRKAEREAEEMARRARLEALCARLEELATADDLKRVQSALKEAQEAFRDAGRAAGELRPRYDAARGPLVIRQQELREAEEWRRWANVPKLEALCKQIEALRDSADTPAKELAQRLKELQAEWKKVGGVPREKSEALWARFKAAGDQVHERAQAHYAVLDEERQKNLALKEQLCVRAETAAESSDWKETTELFKLLQAEWKGIGPVPKDKSDALWQRFRGAADKFFERRGGAVELSDEEKKAVLGRLEAIATEAETLKGSSEWRAAGERLKALQGEWKHAGVGPRAESEALWQRFRGACDEFFGRRKADLDSRGEERAQNLARKEELCVKVEALVAAAGSGAGPKDPDELVRTLMAEWKTVGPAPREQSNAVWNRFRTACDELRRGPEVEPLPEPPADAPPGPKFENKLKLPTLKVPAVAATPAAAEAPAEAGAPAADAATPPAAEPKPA